MDKQAKLATKRPRILTLCFLAAAVSTLALAGCGDGEDDMPPAQQPEAMDQGTADPGSSEEPTMENNPEMQGTATDEQAPAMNNDAAMEDPGLGEGAGTTQEPMPDNGTQGTTTSADSEEESGFGEGTEPMPGAEENDDDEMNSGQ